HSLRDGGFAASISPSDVRLPRQRQSARAKRARKGRHAGAAMQGSPCKDFSTFGHKIEFWVFHAPKSPDIARNSTKY
ncbi:MAG: hypothetical protein ACLSDQ_08700, partial [Adlercreutzia equolifaciens]